MNSACDYSNIVIIETVSQLKKKVNAKGQMKNNNQLSTKEARCFQIQNRFYPLSKCA